MPPRVAVVIPCFNDGRLVAEAVRSVREDEPVEVAIVDDGSTDAETLATLDELQASGVQVVRQANAGPGAARMRGVSGTTAPFVFPLDADDLLEPGTLAAMADALEAAPPEAAFAWGDYVIFGEYDGRYRAPREFLPWSLTYVNQYPISSLYRREALERAGGWQEPTGYEDWDLWLRFAGMGLTGIAVDRIVYRRRLHGSSRLLQGARKRHASMYAQIKARNPDAFGPGRARLRAAERPPVWKRAVYPVLFGRRAVVPFRVEAWLQRTMMQRALRL